MKGYGWIKRDGRAVYTKIDRGLPPARSRLGFPMIITDEMPPAEHVDGRVYTSKASFRAITRREGYIEIGTEKLEPKKPRIDGKVRKQGIRESLLKARAKVF